MSQPIPPLPKTPASVAYFRGYRDFEKGVKYLDNPYMRGTQEFKDWHQGHREAKAVYGG